MVYVVFILISFLASVIGCICGIGGGVIIKPVMDSTMHPDIKLTVLTE